MAILRYVSHGDVIKDPAVAVPSWSLNDAGRRQAARFADVAWGSSVRWLISSAETKALEMAEPFATRHDLVVDVREQTGETDRSATGYVPPDRHEALADAFFAAPNRSAAGWERAVDAQERLLEALEDVLSAETPDDGVVVGHGGVGTLLWCALTEQAIDRRLDQPGPGCVWSFDLRRRVGLHAWEPLEP